MPPQLEKRFEEECMVHQSRALAKIERANKNHSCIYYMYIVKYSLFSVIITMINLKKIAKCLAI